MKDFTLRKLLSAAALVALAGGMALTPTARANTLLWSDEFNGTSVDTNKWNVYDNVSDGSNSWYLASNLVVTNGELIISNRQTEVNGKQWNGGGMEATNYYPQYNYMEARVRITPADCYIWATWWSIGWDFNLNKSIWPPEFDICEFQGNAGKSPGQAYHDSQYGYTEKDTGVDESQWHTYGVYWESNRPPMFYVDGVLSFQSGGSITVDQCGAKMKLTSSPNSQDRYIGAPMGIMEVDYVRVYDTPPPQNVPAGLLSFLQPVTASDETGSTPSYAGNDNNLTSRWGASTGSYPQWWRVDLGASYALTNVTIYWYDASSRYYQYKIEVSSDDSSYTTVVDKTGNTTKANTSDNFSATGRYVRITVTGASGGYASFYECEVFGVAGGGGGNPPPVPTGLAATAVSSSQINLSWNSSSGATSYNVKRSTTSGGPYTTIATGVTPTSYSDTGLSAGTTYYYVVSAVNGNGESANSTQASAITVPSAPTGLTASTVSSSQINLSWNASSGAASYNVKSATVNGGPYTTIASGVTPTSYSNTGLTPNTTYYYVVSAVNSSGESANSSQTNATTSSGGGGTVLLSQGQPVTASSFQGGNAPTNGNDGNFSTRWAASSGTFPQWWRVDLGSIHTLQSVSNYWYSSATRNYQYQIQVSNDDTNYTTVVNKTNNVTDGNTSDAFSATNRYVRIYVTHASAGYASFYESQVFGQ